MQRLWPDPDPTPLSDDALVALYAPTDRDQPWVRANFVASLDGAATLNGLSEGLSGAEDKRIFGILRMLCDALVVGAGTVRNEKYRSVRLSPERRAWRVERGLAEYPTLVVVSGLLDLDPAHPALADAPVRPAILTCADSPAANRKALDAVADVLVHGTGTVDLTAGLAELRERKLFQVLSEGGPHLFGALAAADLVDELCLTLAPLLAGPGAGRITAGLALPEARELVLRQVLSGDGQLFFRYSR
jgi:riboflavin biosynthesis pyrimidine reductase